MSMSNKYECDCGARYEHPSGVEACQLNRHGQPPEPLQVFVALGHHVDDVHLIGVYNSEGAAEKACDRWQAQMEAEFPEGLINTGIEATTVQSNERAQDNKG